MSTSIDSLIPQSVKVQSVLYRDRFGEPRVVEVDQGDGQRKALKCIRLQELAPTAEGVPDSNPTEDVVADGVRLVREVSVADLLRRELSETGSTLGHDSFVLPEPLNVTVNELTGDVMTSMSMPLAGGTLQTVAEGQASPLTTDVLRSVAAQLLTELAAMHACGIAHRDVKPANVFVTQQGLPDIALGDFGLSRFVGVTTMPPTASQERIGDATSAVDSDGVDFSSYVCTRGYRAPELLMAASRYDATVDVWAAGVVLAECALGKRLWSEEALTSSVPLEAFAELVDICGTSAQLRVVGASKEWAAMKAQPESVKILQQIAMRTSNLRGMKGLGHGAPLHRDLVSVGLPEDLVQLIMRMVAPLPSQRPSAFEALSAPVVREFVRPQDCDAIAKLAGNPAIQLRAKEACAEPSEARPVESVLAPLLKRFRDGSIAAQQVA